MRKMFIRDFFVYMNKNKSAQVCLSVAFIATYFMTDKINTPTLKYNDFEFSPDIIRILILFLGFYYVLYFFMSSIIGVFKNKKNASFEKEQKEDILKKLEEMTNEEKALFYYKYTTGNETYIDLTSDSYFYGTLYTSCLVNKKLLYFKNEMEKGVFIRNLEKKGLLEEAGNQTMCIPPLVWQTLKENADKIFK